MVNMGENPFFSEAQQIYYVCIAEETAWIVNLWLLAVYFLR